jgi:hypothetical protein
MAGLSEGTIAQLKALYASELGKASALLPSRPAGIFQVQLSREVAADVTAGMMTDDGED